MRGAFSGCDAIVSCLGQNRASKSLFAKRTSPWDTPRRVADATLAAIGDGSQYLVCPGAFGVGDDRRRYALPFGIVLRPSNIHAAYIDYAEAEAMIQRSSTTWIIVRLPSLTDKDEVLLVDKSDQRSSSETASRESVGAFVEGSVGRRAPPMATITVSKPSV